MVNVKTYVSWERCGSVVCGPSHQYLIRVSLGCIVRLYTSKLKCKKKKKSRPAVVVEAAAVHTFNLSS